MYSYSICFRETLPVRVPVMQSILNSVKPILSDDGSCLLLELPLEAYRPHEISLLRFVLDPNDLAENIFSQLDTWARENLATALMTLYGPSRHQASIGQNG
jgi:hypothetical protein